jgi:hypothetical protein
MFRNDSNNEDGVDKEEEKIDVPSLSDEKNS